MENSGDGGDGGVDSAGFYSVLHRATSATALSDIVNKKKREREREYKKDLNINRNQARPDYFSGSLSERMERKADLGV